MFILKWVLEFVLGYLIKLGLKKKAVHDKDVAIETQMELVAQGVKNAKTKEELDSADRELFKKL